MRPIGTAEELERRRRRAVELVKRGESPAKVAYFLGCGRSSVYTWLKAEREWISGNYVPWRPFEATSNKPHGAPA